MREEDATNRKRAYEEARASEQTYFAHHSQNTTVARRSKARKVTHEQNNRMQRMMQKSGVDSLHDYNRRNNVVSVAELFKKNK